MTGTGDGSDRGPARTRRWFLGTGAAAIGLAVAGCSDDRASTGSTTTSPNTGTNTTTSTSAATDTTAAATTTSVAAGTATGTPATTSFGAGDFTDIGLCTATPEQMAGPFPSPKLIERRDVTEGKPGRPFRLGAQVVDATCKPVPGAVLEIWHCDATGDYSAYIDDNTGGTDLGEGTTFLRGYQVADANGIVEFHTIYPGWYTGRTVHIHTRVHVDDQLKLTTQWYFPDAQNLAVFASAPYLGPPDTTNEQDTIAGDPAKDGTLLTITPEHDGLVGRIRISIG